MKKWNDKLILMFCTKGDDETFLVNPVYKKGTEVYFLYFPGTSENSTIGGVVVKILKN